MYFDNKPVGVRVSYRENVVRGGGGGWRVSQPAHLTAHSYTWQPARQTDYNSMAQAKLESKRGRRTENEGEEMRYLDSDISLLKVVLGWITVLPAASMPIYIYCV